MSQKVVVTLDRVSKLNQQTFLQQKEVNPVPVEVANNKLTPVYLLHLAKPHPVVKVVLLVVVQVAHPQVVLILHPALVILHLVVLSLHLVVTLQTVLRILHLMITGEPLALMVMVVEVHLNNLKLVLMKAMKKVERSRIGLVLQ